jgi:hypothetical protein
MNRLTTKTKKMKAKTKYFTTMYAEQKPDCYGGADFKTHIPMWEAYCEGDKDSTHSEENLILDPKMFPAGTKVFVQEPICPKCDMEALVCIEKKDCDFDWGEWAENKYA